VSLFEELLADDPIAQESEQVGPPPGWDPEEAAARIQTAMHAHPDHKKWLAQTDYGSRTKHFCAVCEPDRPRPPNADRRRRWMETDE